MDPIHEYINALLDSPRLGSQTAHHRLQEGREAKFAEPRRAWPAPVRAMLDTLGIEQLYEHQAGATDRVRAGRHVVTATPTASGKTLVYNLPVFERVSADPETRALYMYPLKALAQDQFRVFNKMADALPDSLPDDRRPTAAIYDGDTTPHFRKKIRDNPPNALMTNPEMVHLSLLPHHASWASFFAGLSFVVVDEVHTYRGVMGAHMAQVFRRLQRICRYYGSDPVFIFSSATVGNPAELCTQLTGLEVEAVTESGAARGGRHMVFLNPHDSPAQAAILLLQSALARNLRTIVYTQSRKMTELIAMWASERSGEFKDKISAYRAGFLPEERRDIESKLSSGELLAVISTSALELGIDIGGLDLCVLCGYPGTVMQTLQRGGRVGRALRDSAVVLVAGEDALDQYFMRNPDDFFSRPPENAVVNPENPVILERHLVCAAAELSLKCGEKYISGPESRRITDLLVARGDLLHSASGDEYYAKRKRPHRDVDLRGAGQTLTIENAAEGVVGSIDLHRAFKETHPGAVYLHRGKTYLVSELDTGSATVHAEPARVGYYTRVRGEKSTEILEIKDAAQVRGTRVFFGRLRVTENITGYEKRSVRGGKLLTLVPLDLPPLVFETEGLWFEIPDALRCRAEEEYLHFMGGIHAVEHAAIGILPLTVLADRNDLGGISTPMHQQVGTAAVFIYDGLPGGAGLTRQAFGCAEELLEKTLQTITECECELGCPSCVHSPKCGSGNRPIDKHAAVFVLQGLLDRTATPAPLPEITPVESNDKAKSQSSDIYGNGGFPAVNTLKFGVLDIETRRSAQEVGGWNRADRMGVSVAVLYDSDTDEFIDYLQDDIEPLIERLQTFDLVIGFNILRFDYNVLSGLSSFPFQKLPTLDLLKHVHERLGYRLKLDNIASATLNTGKTADGLQALEWWKEGKLDLITEYCRADVRVTRDVYLHGKEHGYVLFTNKARKQVRLPVDW